MGLRPGPRKEQRDHETKEQEIGQDDEKHPEVEQQLREHLAQDRPEKQLEPDDDFQIQPASPTEQIVQPLPCGHVRGTVFGQTLDGLEELLDLGAVAVMPLMQL